MSEIKKPEAYFRKLVRNSTINEYRANDNSYKHISPVGDELYKKADSRSLTNVSNEAIEDVLSEESPQNWLMFIENRKLYQGMISLTDVELEFLFLKFSSNLTQREMAVILNISQVAVCKRYNRILKKLKKYF